MNAVAVFWMMEGPHVLGVQAPPAGWGRGVAPLSLDAIWILLEGLPGPVGPEADRSHRAGWADRAAWVDP